MSFQKCPLCGGCGTTGVGFPTGDRCRVCHGIGIISELTGLPPNIEYEISATTNSDNIKIKKPTADKHKI